MNEPKQMRQIDQGEGSRVIHTPQCVGCKHNLGLMNCAAMNTKPDIFLMNEEECPARENGDV